MAQVETVEKGRNSFLCFLCLFSGLAGTGEALHHWGETWQLAQTSCGQLCSRLECVLTRVEIGQCVQGNIHSSSVTQMFPSGGKHLDPLGENMSLT